MDRTLGDNHITVGGKRQFTDGPPGTTIDADHMNQVQEEIVTAITNAGLTPSSTDRTQLYQAILELSQNTPNLHKLAAAQWFEAPNPKNFELRGVAAGGDNVNYFNIVAVGEADGADAYIVTSSDRGVSWTERANAKNISLHMVAWGRDPTAPASVWAVAVGDADGADAYILSSMDGGSTWGELANGKNFNLYGICYGQVDGSFYRWVAVGAADGVDAYIVTQGMPEGGGWTESANPKNVALRSVCYSASLGLFCAVGEGDGADAYIVTSPSGLTGTWTERSNPQNLNLRSVCWAEELGLFVAVGHQDGMDAYIVTSPDGETWTERKNPKAQDLRSVTWNGYLFVAVGADDGVMPYILTSPDGIYWAQRHTHSAKAFDLLGVCHEEVQSQALSLDSSRFCAVGNADGTDGYVLLSIAV